MKLDDYVDTNKVTVSQIGKQVAYDTETTYDGLSQRTIAVSPIVRSPLPCDKCHCKVYQLYSVFVGFALHYFCITCYLKEKERKNKL